MVKARPVDIEEAAEALVPGRWVHRHHFADTLITSARALGSQKFQCGLQWPVNHVLFGRGAGIDSALIAEFLRQATTYIAHTMFGVEIGVQFLMTRLSVSVLQPRHVLPDARHLTMTVLFSELQRNVQGVSRFSSHVQIYDGDTCLGTGSAHARLVSSASSDRLQPTQPDLSEPVVPLATSRILARRVGVVEQRLVLVRTTPTAGTYTLEVDPANPAFFDHPLNHVPGMMLFEAARQAVRHHANTPSADFESVDFVFSAMIALNTPTQLCVESRSPQSLAIIVQAKGPTGTSAVAELTGSLRAQSG